ncbi:hypothetical protein [Photobacterium indicum]|jgi:hypothetical protein|uniref:Uncharacterized protein n=1 Tax=Photobacterium indicum TaxID=81447 RepID=A0A2T3LDA2_9GAMM|nr:hypothetical protein [Photobacterium indicum]PSV49360.1 hypothetical protein C9J47_01990 [Photobacterium indicum]
MMMDAKQKTLKEDRERQKVLKLLADTNKAIYNKKWQSWQCLLIPILSIMGCLMLAIIWSLI